MDACDCWVEGGGVDRAAFSFDATMPVDDVNVFRGLV